MAERPKAFKGIMLSSTFTDLKEHRLKAKLAIEKLGFHAIGMESGGAQATDVIDVSLRYVHESAAYIGIITKKYGQTPDDPRRNPDSRSITELEFDEALRLDRPILLFIMAEEHKVLESDIELDPDRRAKLQAFKSRAKLMRNDGKVERVWEAFSSLEDFAERVGPAIGNLARELEAPKDLAAVPEPAIQEPARPAPPALRALPPYIGSHDFVGRSAELEVLDDWATPADPHPVLLFEAMGGTGKSMLTWHWVNHRAPKSRSDWSGRFWYSFYEQGATLAGFCREALSYITGLRAKSYSGMRSRELGERLLGELDRAPWLLVLDGLERILVGYQRTDAAQVRDEEADSISDPLADRDPCLAIRPEDDELLRRLAAVTRSKLLISTRLTPAKLVNKSGQAIGGVKRELLKGLRPPDAEALFRACGVRGQSAAMQAFLQTNCDGHPLVVGVLAGLVNDYLPDRGNFEAWRDDPNYGAKLDWASLDLVQRRNHILDEAIAALDPMSLQLLQGLAILIGGADYGLLEAINPHLPPRPAEVVQPDEEEHQFLSEFLNEKERKQEDIRYRQACEKYNRFREALDAWAADPAVSAAPRRLTETVRDLERRSLLQYDPDGHRYDLHPVVRGVASARMSGEENASSGGRVVDYCRAASPSNWDHAETLEDVALGRQFVATLIRIGRYDEALGVYRGSLADTLRYRLEANAELAGVLRDFFPAGWDGLPAVSSTESRSWLITSASLTLEAIDAKRALALSEQALALDLKEQIEYYIAADLNNLARHFGLATRDKIYDANAAFSKARRSNEDSFVNELRQFTLASWMGDDRRAETLWQELSAREKPILFTMYRPGDAEGNYAWHCFRRGELSEAVLEEAEAAAATSRNRFMVRGLARLRGMWLIERGQPAAASASLEEAVAMARAIGEEDSVAEAALALARVQGGDRDGARADARTFGRCDGPTSLYVALVWAQLGERERAVAEARRTHDWAVGDGEPYVYRWHLDRARALLAELGAELPEIPQHNPDSVPKFDWEADLRALTARIEAGSERREAEQAAAVLSEDEDGFI